MLGRFRVAILGHVRLEATPGHAEGLHACTDVARENARRRHALAGELLGLCAVGLQSRGQLAAQVGEIGVGALNRLELALQTRAMRGQLRGRYMMLARQLLDGREPPLHLLLARAIELERLAIALELDSARQEEVQRRLAAVEELARKHHAAPAELPAQAARLVAELETLERADTDLADLRRELATALQAYRAQAQQLSGKRMATARVLARDISTRMQALGMAGGRFEVDVTQDGNADPAQHGIDQIEFRVTANPGSPPRALAKVASGGELSRLSLAVQVACAAQEMRCMVFDDVDAGIGGAVAEIVGRELRSLGVRGQVLCVTHLPQVACQAHHHLRVTKLSDGRTTRTTLAELDGDQRVEELARMLGGVEITAKAREHARDMLSAATLAAAAGAASGATRDAAGKGDTVRQPRPPAARRR